MPRARKLPDDDTLVSLKNQGYLNREIADMYDVTPAAVSNAFSHMGQRTPAWTYHDYTPWKFIREDHRQGVVFQHVRVGDRIERGEAVPPYVADLYFRWAKDLADTNRVVCYDVDAEPNPASSIGGFYYRSRRDTDQPGLLQADA